VKRGTAIPIIPGQPNRNPRTIAAPMIPKGNIRAANPIGNFSYIKLKSFDSMFVTLARSEALIIYWDKEDNFANRT